MRQELLEDIKKVFPDYKSKKFDYEVAQKDLLLLFDIINEHVFKNKLDKLLIDVFIENWPNAKDKGTFSLSKKEKNRSCIHIHRSQIGNENFGQIVSVLCHEMIHVYDRYHGPLKNLISNEIFSDHDYMEVSNINRNQLVNGYNAHGKYFMAWVEKFNQFGIIVKVTYNPSDNRLMKKLDEGFDAKLDEDMIRQIYGDNALNENEREVDDPAYKDFLRSRFGAIKNCKKNFTYIDKDNWVFSMS